MNMNMNIICISNMNIAITIWNIQYEYMNKQ